MRFDQNLSLMDTFWKGTYSNALFSNTRPILEWCWFRALNSSTHYLSGQLPVSPAASFSEYAGLVTFPLQLRFRGQSGVNGSGLWGNRRGGASIDFTCLDSSKIEPSGEVGEMIGPGTKKWGAFNKGAAIDSEIHAAVSKCEKTFLTSSLSLLSLPQWDWSFFSSLLYPM